MDKFVRQKLTDILKKSLPLEKNNRVLIIGGRCGATAEILAPFCRQIDIVEEDPYLSNLNVRLIEKKDISYRFNS